MNEIHIHNSRKELWIMLLIGLFLLIGLGGIPFWVTIEPHPGHPAWLGGLMEWSLGITFATLSIAVIRMGAKQLFSNEPPLTIDEEGILDRRINTGKIPWAEISEVREIDTKAGPQIMILLKDPEYRLKRSPGWRRQLSRIERRLKSADVVVELGGLATTSGELIKLIEEQYVTA